MFHASYVYAVLLFARLNAYNLDCCLNSLSPLETLKKGVYRDETNYAQLAIDVACSKARYDESICGESIWISGRGL